MQIAAGAPTSPQPLPPYAEIRERVLLAVLKEVPTQGWSKASLRAATRQCDLPIEAGELAFPNGVEDLLAAFSAWADRQMLAGLAQQTPPPSKVREKIAAGLWQRFLALAPYEQAVGPALCSLALPPHVGLAARLAWASADALWWAAGDTATDFNHYSKRALLLWVMQTSVIFWLQDQTPGKAATQAFIMARLGEVVRFGQISGQLRQTLAQPLSQMTHGMLDQLAKWRAFGPFSGRMK
jgi:ubiquinone biosynthesis protein COQ9